MTHRKLKHYAQVSFFVTLVSLRLKIDDKIKQEG